MIPRRAETLEILRLIGRHAPLLMLAGDEDGYGARWTLDGQEVEPAIARYLMGEGYVAEFGATEFGAKKLGLTAAGTQFLRDGINWWAHLNLLQKLKIMLFG